MKSLKSLYNSIRSDSPFRGGSENSPRNSGRNMEHFNNMRLVENSPDLIFVAPFTVHVEIVRCVIIEDRQ